VTKPQREATKEFSIWITWSHCTSHTLFLHSPWRDQDSYHTMGWDFLCHL